MISLGDSDNALRISVLTVTIGLIPMKNWMTEWKIGFGLLFLGWFLSHPLSLELLAAPQWTIPTLFMGHVYWKLTLVQQQLQHYKMERDENNDEEMTSFSKSNNNRGGLSALMEESSSFEDSMSGSQNGMRMTTPENHHDDLEDDDSVMSTSVFSFSTNRPDATLKQRCLQAWIALSFHVYFGSWMLLTILCFWTMDWTLVVGNIMTISLCIGSIVFPRHLLWSLYSMFSNSLLILINIMTMVGWYSCQVAITTITTTKQNAWMIMEPKHIWASIILQTILHTIVLLYTTTTARRNHSQVPLSFFWEHVKIIGDECTMWYYVCS